MSESRYGLSATPPSDPGEERPDTDPICDRCRQPRSVHRPGYPPKPPQTKGHLGATENRPGCCNNFRPAPTDPEASGPRDSRAADRPGDPLGVSSASPDAALAMSTPDAPDEGSRIVGTASADPGEQERCCPGCGAQAGEGQRRTATGEWCQHDWHNRPPQQAGEQRPERFGDWRDTVKQPNPDGTWTVECPTCHQDWTVPSGGQGVLFEIYNLERALKIAHDTIAELGERHPEEADYIVGRNTVEHDSWDGALN